MLIIVIVQFLILSFYGFWVFVVKIFKGEGFGQFILLDVSVGVDGSLMVFLGREGEIMVLWEFKGGILVLFYFGIVFQIGDIEIFEVCVGGFQVGKVKNILGKRRFMSKKNKKMRESRCFFGVLLVQQQRCVTRWRVVRNKDGEVNG